MTTSLRNRVLSVFIGTICVTHLAAPLRGQTNNWTLSGNYLTTGNEVGIGTATPNAPLHVAQGVFQSTTPVTFLRLQQTGFADNARIRIGFTGYVDSVLQTAIDSIQNSASNWQSQLAFSVNNGAALNEAMRITSNGNVGMGTTSPNVPLEISQPGSNILLWTARVTNPSNTALTGYGTGLQFFNSTTADNQNKWAGVAGVAQNIFSSNVRLAFHTQGDTSNRAAQR